MNFEDWYEGADGERARQMNELLIGQVQDAMKFNKLLLEQAYIQGTREGLDAAKEMYDAK